MIVVEIPAELAQHPEVVPVDPPEPCPACGCYPTDIDQDVRARCEFCDDRGEGFALSSLVGQRVALAWRETCPTCDGSGETDRRCKSPACDGGHVCSDCKGSGSRMVVGWTAEVAEVRLLVDRGLADGVWTTPSGLYDLSLPPLVGPCGPGNYHLAPHDVMPLADWSPGRYALVLRDVQTWSEAYARAIGVACPNLPPFTCRPFSGFAELGEVL